LKRKTARAGIAQACFRGGGGEGLVHHHHRHAVAGGEPPRELLGELRHRMLGIVGVARAADDETGRAPLVHQLLDLAEALVVGGGVDGAQRVGDAGPGLAHRHANAPLTEIEADERAAGRGHACPASSERLAVFTPRMRIAAS